MLSCGIAGLRITNKPGSGPAFSFENQQPFTLPNRLRIACYVSWQNTFFF
jgi:hypothetical protein